MDSRALGQFKVLYRDALAEIARLRTLLGQSAATRLPVSDTCWMCAWFSGVFCHRHKSPLYKQAIENPKETVCGYYLYTQYPRGELIAKVGDPERDKEKQRHPAPGESVQCPSCGHFVKVRRDGDLYQHDTQGRTLRNRGCSPERVKCPGKPDPTLRLLEAVTQGKV